MSMKFDSMKMESSPRPERMLNQSAAAAARISFNRNSKRLDEIVVGMDGDAELIRDKLVEDQKKLDVISIVGMGGIGKTTLATKVFNDGYVKHHFYVRVWVTVSQTYDKRAVLIQILASMDVKLEFEKTSDSKLHEMVHKYLMNKRYLIVIDDIWNIDTWDNLKLFFPHDNNGSRILLTSRLTEVVKHATSNGLIHHLGHLSKERSWDLLCQKVFHGNECPEWSIKPGMQIVANCQGLPLAVVVIAGVLAKEACSEKLWEEISYKTGSYLVGDQNGCLEILASSYNHLPLHLRECFLYLGGLPEDYEFEVRWLSWLWVAEGFIQQGGDRCLEDVAEGYLMDLIDRNLVIVVDRRESDGGVKACKVHDLVKELCLKKAKEEGFILQTERLILSSELSNVTTLRLHEKAHLRYLAIQNSSEDFPSSICDLWNLQTLIYFSCRDTVLPRNISDLVSLRHLSYNPSNSGCLYLKNIFFLPSIDKPMKLQTISHVVLGDGVDNFQKCFPYIKELTCTTYTEKENDFQSLTYLEKLKYIGIWDSCMDDSPKGEPSYQKNHITFPETLKTLTLKWCALPWSDMSIIQSLPNLQVLKLKRNAFMGSCWKADEQEFRQLKFLRLEKLDIKLWEACSSSFPCLRQLEILFCYDLEEIPLEIGDIPTLELIKIMYCKHSVGESVRRIEEEQQNMGNYDLKTDVLYLVD
ncbi:putative late blight resistance protein homolog R1A-4 [Helianthus annuus]|uniref:putative late blight resistance protein homolog R1A-4 n=1 Tax=Helianthus annuus TaxID=4232 RepID=UPI000B8F3E28|nr:putative late blight resistance protein homolog R1A-4 [Helianthus annuus]